MRGVGGQGRTGALWSRGEFVALRDIWFDAVWRAIAAIAIEDDGVTSVFWIPVGSSASYPADEAGREIRMPQREFTRARRRTPWACVVSCDSREPWTLWHFQAPDGRFDRWYVNFEHYLGRTAIAYDSIDHKLDLIARPDRSLEWKDEDELEAADRLGLVDAKAVRAEAQRVLANPPWPTGWEDFEPDPGWSVAELPRGWDRRSQDGATARPYRQAIDELLRVAIERGKLREGIDPDLIADLLVSPPFVRIVFPFGLAEVSTQYAEEILDAIWYGIAPGRKTQRDTWRSESGQE